LHSLIFLQGAAHLYSKFKLAASALFFSITLIILQCVLAGFIPAALAQRTPIYYFEVQNGIDPTMNALLAIAA
jgi:hypothetical protein